MENLNCPQVRKYVENLCARFLEILKLELEKSFDDLLMKAVWTPEYKVDRSMLAVVHLDFSVCTFSVALSMDADADLGDEGEDDDDGVVVG